MDGPKNSAAKGYAKVWLTKDPVIVCELHGYIDEQTARGSLADTKKFINQLKSQNQPARLFIDAKDVTGQSSGARSLAKTIGNMGLQKIAIRNRSAVLDMIIQYLIRGGGMAAYAQVFSSKAQAFAWLIHGQKAQQHDPNTRLRFGLAIVVLVIAGLGLAGWAADNEMLRSVVEGLKPMNPVVSVILLLQALLLLIIKKAGTIPAASKAAAGVIAGVTFIFGGLVILQLSTGINLHVDSWLFSDKIGHGYLSGLAAPRAAVLLQFIAVMEFLVLVGERKHWQKVVFHVTSVIVFFVGLASVIGYGFGSAGLYEYTNLLPIPLNTAICLLLLNHALQTVVVPLPYFERGLKNFNKNSPAVFVGLAMVLITGVAWHQSTQDQQRIRLNAAKEQFTATQDLIDSKVNAYINTLRGYRSFFEASDFVSAKEFSTYFDSSKLSKYYPGFTAISFARYVPASQRASFNAGIRQQADASHPSYKSFTIFPASQLSFLYPTIYVEPHTPTTNYGFDLATNTARRQALEAARDSGEVVASDTIDLNAARADSSLPKRPGFYITIPIYKNGGQVPSSLQVRRDKLYGFVNAIFEDKILFNDIFKTTRQKNIKFILTKSGQTLYAYNANAKDVQPKPTYADNIKVAGQTWQLALYAPPHLGVQGITRYLPNLILAGGLLVAALAVALIAGQIKRKEQAMSLANEITKDLNSERDEAVTIQQKDEAILSSIGDAVFAVDIKGRVVLFNRAAAVITGLSEDNVLGKPYDKIFHFRHDKDDKPANHFIAQALSGKQATMAQGTTLTRHDGTTVPVADSAAPIVNARGQVEGAVVVFRDITREKELEKLKNDFVSMASHELRTPMGAVRAISSMILAGDYGKVNKNLVEPLTDIHDSTLRLVDLVNDLLNVARIEANRMKFDLKETPLKPVLQGVADSLAPLGKEKGIAVTLDAGKLPAVQADKDKVIQVVTNLVGNSLKFTDKGSITLAAVAQKDMVEVTVTDTGGGISAKNQARLFGKFQQVSSAQKGRPAGTGLGLYISREIIRKMGGDLWIKSSELGQGSTFAFTLPVAKSPKAQRVMHDRARDQKQHPDSV